MKIETASDINKEILKIWGKAAKDFKDLTDSSTEFLSPCFFPEDVRPENCKLLIIGLNPSYSIGGWKKILDNYKGDHSSRLEKLIANKKEQDTLFKRDLDDYFLFEKLDNKKEEILKLDGTAVEGHDYFKKMHEIEYFIYENDPKSVKNANNKVVKAMYHLDLFFYRKTNQKELQIIMDSNVDFFNKQRELSKSIIQWLDPEIILITNAFARDEFKKMFSVELNSSQELVINEDTLTHEIEINQHKVIPLFFSGMLSGQRALDNGSFERLKWHMKAVKDGKKMKK